VASKVSRHETAKGQQIQKSNTNTYFAISESGMAGKCQEKTLTIAIACRSLIVIATSAKVRCSTSGISACSIATSMVYNVLTLCTVEFLSWNPEPSHACVVLRYESFGQLVMHVSHDLKSLYPVPSQRMAPYASNIRSLSTCPAGQTRLYATST